MRVRSMVVMSAILLGLSAAPASAQWFVSPSVGASFGAGYGSSLDDTNNSGTNNSIASDSNLTFGVSGGYKSDHIWGWEVAFDMTPGLLDAQAENLNLGSNIDGNVSTLMFNALAVAPHTWSAEPYGAFGMGWINSGIVNAVNTLDVHNTDFGFNVGGGLLGDFNENVGWRADLRYNKSLGGSATDSTINRDLSLDVDRDFGLGSLGFWRSSFGVTFKWGG